MNEKTLELQIKIIAEQALAQVKTLSGDLKNLAGQAKTFSNDSKAVKDTFQQWHKEANTASSSFGQLKTAITQTAGAIALIKTVDKLQDITSFALKQADAFQTARNEYGILLGDMEAGAGLFNQVKAFNDKTPFDLNTTKQAVNVLLSADVPLTQINERLRQFGDLSQGNSQRFSSYIDAFSKAAAKGKVDMQVLNTYMNQGVPILKELAAGFGVTQEEIMDMVSKGQVGFRDFSSALERLTAEGGKYFGGMELGSKSLAAMQEGLKESVNSLAASYGNVLMPGVIKVLEIFTSIINAINESPILKGVLAGAVVALTGYLAAMAVKQAALAAKTWLAYAAQMGFNSALAVTNPALLAGIAVAAAATVAVVALASAQQNATNKSADAALKAKAQADAYRNVAAAAREKAEAINDMGVTNQNNFLQNEQKKLAELLAKRAEAERLFRETPRMVPQSFTDRSGNTITAVGPDAAMMKNPLFEQRQKELAAFNFQVTQTEANIDAIIDKMTDLEKESLKAFGREWQDKLLTGTKALDREQEKAIAELQAKARISFKDDYESNASYLAELDALKEYYRRKRNELNEKDLAKLGSAWQEKMASSAELLEIEYKKSLEELNKKAQEVFGQKFSDKETYKDELNALEDFYKNKRRDLEMETIMQAHNLRMENLRKEMEYQKELARENSDYLKFAGHEAMSAMGDTDVGQMINTIQSGGNPWMALISIVIKAVASLESFSEALNFITKFVKDVFGKVDHLVRNAMSNLYDVLDELGEVISDILPVIIFLMKLINDSIAFLLKTLMPILKIIGEVFEWLYNKVMVPFGNALIGLMNGIISLVNKIPGVNIKKLQYFEYAGQIAEDLAIEMERRKDEITNMYERQKDRVRDELAAQISSIRAQYELGLMSRADYEKQAEAYQSAADLKLLDINEEMLKELEKINLNTYAALDTKTQQAVEYRLENGGAAGLLQTGAALYDPITTGVVSTITSAAKGDWLNAGLNAATGGLWGGIKKIFGFSTGTPFVPHDMIANIHQGEGIIPRTFNDGIRSGEYALVGRNSGNRNRVGEKNITVNLTVTGSVVTERELTSVIYRGIAEGIKAGDYTPMPA